MTVTETGMATLIWAAFAGVDTIGASANDAVKRKVRQHGHAHVDAAFALHGCHSCASPPPYKRSPAR